MLWQHAVGKSAAMSGEGCHADMGTVKAGLPSGGIVVNEHVSPGRSCNPLYGSTMNRKNRGEHQCCSAVGDRVYSRSGACTLRGNLYGQTHRANDKMTYGDVR